jgi:hypothetical protein
MIPANPATYERIQPLATQPDHQHDITPVAGKLVKCRKNQLLHPFSAGHGLEI